MNETNLIEDVRRLSPPDPGWLLGVGLACLAVLALGWLWLRFRPRPGVAAAEHSPAGPTPWEVALAELERLTPLLCPAASRDYGMAATAVLRRFVERRYALDAPRLATEEFLIAASRARELPSAHRDRLGRFLEWCDLFKFGRYTAGADELRQLHTAAVDFVLASRPA